MTDTFETAGANAAFGAAQMRPTKALAAEISEIQRLLAPDLQQLNTILRAELNSDVELINQIGDYLIAAGGKRLRPMLVILVARALGAQGAQQHAAASMAAIIELIHTATLLHDDVVDESEQRRNRKTANALWGNAASVLVGDFLYSRAFQMMVRLSQMRVMTIMANTTNAIAEGEVLQLIHRRDASISRQQYQEVIKRKTAVLFEAACRLGAVCMGADAKLEAELASFGLNLGFAFQIADDLLDYTGDAALIGKNLGDDLAEGKTTLPLIAAMERGDSAQRNIVRQAIETGGVAMLDDVIQVVNATGAIDVSREAAMREARRAINAARQLPEGPHTYCLIQLATQLLGRNS